MNHSELSIIDLLIVGIYLVAMVAIGVYSVRKIKNTGDYFVAGHSFGPRPWKQNPHSYEKGIALFCSLLSFGKTEENRKRSFQFS